MRYSPNRSVLAERLVPTIETIAPCKGAVPAQDLGVHTHGCRRKDERAQRCSGEKTIHKTLHEDGGLMR